MSVAIQQSCRLFIGLNYSLKYVALLQYRELTFNSASILFFKRNDKLK